MDLMENLDLNNQVTVLQGTAMEEEEENINSEVEDLSNSLRAIVQEEIVKPKLQCLMMDPTFSMITLQSEDSGILWETASSRCTTPWTSEISSPAPELCNTLVPRYPNVPGSESAGRIIFTMDDHMSKTKTRKRNKTPEKTKITDEVPGEPVRPAMVEVSVPNVKVEKDNEDDRKNSKEARKQSLFCLVSEGSEILNIVVPPKLSTVDEEESKKLKDKLFYLENTPVIKVAEIPEEPEASEKTENHEHLQATVQALSEPPALPQLIRPAQKQGVYEDYFEKFTLLDHQAISVVPTVDANQAPETTTEQGELCEREDKASGGNGKLAMGASDDSGSITGLEITGEHVDEVFYGIGLDPDFQNTTKEAGKEEELPKLSLKKSGCDLFGSQESILTPIFLPEGRQKIIDLVLLEEPKAMAFMYSDLYADAVGSRNKQEDTESVTSEKSFHSQESDFEDRGYLEKFVLKDETPVTPVDPLHDECREDGVRMWSQDLHFACGLTQTDKNDTGTLDDIDEITDFFRNSASSSPCEPILQRQEELEEIRTETKPRRVVFQDEGQERTIEEDIDIAEAFLPHDVGKDSLAFEESLKPTDYKSVIAQYAAKTCAATPSKSGKNRFSSKVKPTNQIFIPTHIPQTVKPITPIYKPFLELTPLLPVEMPEQDEQKEAEGRDEVCSCTVKGEKTSIEAQDYEQITQQGVRGSALMPQPFSSTGREVNDNVGLTAVGNPSQLTLLSDAFEMDNETVAVPMSQRHC